MKTTTNHEKITGTITRIFYSSPEFTAGRIDTGRSSENFAGAIYVNQGEAVTLYGEWGLDKKYGRQFHATGVALGIPEGERGLIQFIQQVDGIGPVTAEKVVKALGTGEEFEKGLFGATIGVIAKKCGVDQAKIKRLRELWESRKEEDNAIMALLEYDLTQHEATSLVKRYGTSAVSVIQENPYQAIGQIDGLGFRKIDAIAMKFGIDKYLDHRIMCGLLYCLSEASRDGHRYLDEIELIDRANKLLILDDVNSKEMISNVLDFMIFNNSNVFASAGRISIEKDYDEEQFLVECFAKKENPHSEKIDFSWLNGDTLTQEQYSAAQSSVVNGLTMITGSAGTGKTYVCQEIVRIYQRAGLSVEIAAPTGKAAKRIEEVVGLEARTIHRLLDFNPQLNCFSKNENNKIRADLIIIDEFSMVDAGLAYNLFLAIDFSTTAVVLVGDPNQLPPVGSGNPMRDICRHEPFPVIHLTEIKRQAGALKENCNAVLAGSVPASIPPNLNASGRDRRAPWYKVCSAQTTENVAKIICDLFEGGLQDKLEYDLVEDVQVLTPTHIGPAGTLALNGKLQEIVQKKVYGRSGPFSIGSFFPGDKILQTKNDYDLDVMNGAVGSVYRVCKDESIIALFDGREVEIPKSKRKNITLAYSMTIHKSQGSEFPCVIVVCHKSHSYQHHRNLLYTAVTRARESVILVGDNWGMTNCVRKIETDRRNTWLDVLLNEKKKHEETKNG